MPKKTSKTAEQLSFIESTNSVQPSPISPVASPQVPTPERGRAPSSLGSLLAKFAVPEKPGYISREFQDFGYRLALELNDPAHKSLYFKMAKKEDRLLLEQALSFVSDSKAQSKAKLFMWKVGELKKAQVEAENKA